MDVGSVTVDAAAAHGERAEVDDAAAVIGGVAGDAAVPQGKSVVVGYTTSRIAVLVGDLARSVDAMAVGDVQLAFFDPNNTPLVCTVNRVTVEAEVNVGVACPSVREGHVVGKVVVAWSVG